MIPDGKTFALNMLAMNLRYADAGTQEEGGNNQGWQVERFQAVNDGSAGDAWCDDYISFIGLRSLADMLHVPYTVANAVYVFRSMRPTLEHHFFTPSDSCSVTKGGALLAGKWLSETERKATGRKPLPGWLVIYDWAHDGKPSHIEQIVSADDNGLNTCGGNTPGVDRSGPDGVHRKRRAYADVLGYVMLYQG